MQMDSLYILIPIAVVFVAVAISAFLWAVNNRQYDDLDSEAQRILFEDDAPLQVNDKSSPSVATQEDSTSGKKHAGE